MATWAIGDVQGCLDSLIAWMQEVTFTPGRDTLIVVGDLVNRGPRSADVLRYLRGMGDAVQAVLGNHDLHLLACAAGAIQPGGKDTVSEILEAPDATALIDWVRGLPLVLTPNLEVAQPYVVVHAGLHPNWTVAEALVLSHRLQDALAGPDWKEFVTRAAKSRQTHWDAPDPNATATAETERLIGQMGWMTRVRACTPEAKMDRGYKGGYGKLPAGLLAWFDLPAARWTDHHALFGHWAALGFREGPHWTCLDSGCVWGNRLTGIRLEDRTVVSIPAQEPRRAGPRAHDPSA